MKWGVALVGGISSIGLIGVASAYTDSTGLLDQVTMLSSRSVVIGGIVLAVLVLFSIAFKPSSELAKSFLFWPMVITTLLSSFILISSTIYLNNVSYSKGPVHWHADFEVWACGQEYELVDPKGLSNKIGSAVLHEHNDKRIHLEGVLVERNEASLGYFFETVGGELTNESLALPTNEGLRHWQNGDRCGSGLGEVQAFAITVKDKKIVQEKLAIPNEYVYSGHSQVPPGDCIIVEFDSRKATTDKLCRSYEVERTRGKIR